MKQLKLTYLTFFLILTFSWTSYSQIKSIGIPFIKSYDPLIYKAESQNWCITQDNRGYIYFANSAGVLAFDGINWNLIKLPNNGETRTLYKDKKGKIWVGGYNEIGYLTVDSINQIIYKSIVNQIPKEYQNFSRAWNIFEQNENLIVETTNNVFVFNKNKFKAYTSKNEYHTSYLVNNTFFVREWNRGLLKLKDDSLILIENGEIFSENKVSSILAFDENKFLIASRSEGLYIYDGKKIERWNIEINNKLKQDEIYCGVSITKDYFAFGTLFDGIFIIDKQGKLIQHLNKKRGLPSDIIYYMFLDSFNNLWVNSGYGISHIEILSQYSSFSSENNLSGKAMMINLLNNILYVAGEQSLYYYDLKANNSLDSSYIFHKIENTNGQIWNTIIVNNIIYFLNNTSIFKVENLKAKETFSYKNQNFWKIIQLPNYRNKYLIGTDIGFITVNYTNDFVLNTEVIGFENYCRFFEIDSLNNIWITVPTEGVYKIKINNNLDSISELKFYDIQNGLPSSLNNYVNKINNELIFSTQKGFYKYDYKLDTFVTYNKFNKYINSNSDVLISGIDKLNNIWLEDSAGYAYLNFNNDSIIFNNVNPNKLTYKLVSYFYPYNQNNLFFGTKDGVIHFDAQIENKTNTNFNSTILKVETIIDNKIIFGGNYITEDSIFTNLQSINKILKFKHNNNSFRFFVGSCFYEDAEFIKFKYKLEGFDKKWSDWTDKNTKEYTNLPPGKYEFKTIAKNIYQVQSTETSYKFIILKPWYQTYFAYFCYIILTIGIFIILLKINVRRLEKNNEKLEAKILERTSLIQFQKSELEQQKEEILAQAEELEKINKELFKLSTIASETDNAILVMDKEGYFEWVNTAYTKIFGYTLDELTSGISNNIIGENTSDDIKTIIKSCMNEKKTVEYELLTKNKIGNRIWIKTTLTPIINSDGEIRNLVAIDSDITKNKEAEIKINLQNENIKGSIRYALTIQKTILPDKAELDKYFENFIIYRPKDIVSGDFYWMNAVVLSPNILNAIKNKENFTNQFLETLGKYIFVCVVDCTGHGVPGAFMSLIGSRLLSEIINEKSVHSPKRILEQLDTRLKNVLKQSQTNSRDGMDISLCRIENSIVDNQAQIKIIYSGAKLSILYYDAEKQKLEKTISSRRNIGGNAKFEPEFTNTEILLNPTDTIFMYSDGFKDQSNVERKKYGTSQIINIIQNNLDKNLNDIKLALEQDLDQWQGDEEQRDDITLIGIKF